MKIFLKKIALMPKKAPKKENTILKKGKNLQASQLYT